MGAAIYLEDNLFTAEDPPHTATPPTKKKKEKKEKNQPKTKNFFGN